MMETITELRNKLIDKLLLVDNSDLLNEISLMIDAKELGHSKVQISEAQSLLLTMSDQDIKLNRLVDQEDLTAQDLEWLNGK